MPKRTGKSRGFSLLELLASMAIMLVISAAAFSFLIFYQKNYVSTALKADMHSSVRNATELLEQEIGQAGLVSLPQTALANPGVTATSSVAQAVPVASTAGMYVGEKLQIDLGINQETVAITAIASNPAKISGIFSKLHSQGAIVKAVGVFQNGILPNSSATQLNMFGDINGDGTLVFVQYNCTSTNGTLTRSVSLLSANVSSPGKTLLENLVSCNIFTKSTQTVAGYTFVTGVGVTFTTNTAENDPITGVPAQETKVYQNLAPRNLINGLAIATAAAQPGGNTTLLNYIQPEPGLGYGGCLLQQLGC